MIRALMVLLLWSVLSAVAQADSDAGAVVRTGTGWVLSSHFIVTNQHVVGAADLVLLIRNDNRQLVADVVVRDPNNDLVLLKPREPDLLPPALPLAAAPANVGASVFTLGYPLLSVMGCEAKMTTGYVSARTGLQGDPRAYQISVPIQPGNSGGPVLNMNGEVIGIATATLDITNIYRQSGALPQNVNYAAKCEYVKVLRDTVSSDGPQVATLVPSSANLEKLFARVGGSVMIVLSKDDANDALSGKPDARVDQARQGHDQQIRLAMFVYVYPSGYDKKGPVIVTSDSYSANLVQLMQASLNDRYGQSVLLVDRDLGQRARSNIYSAYHNAKRDGLCRGSHADAIPTAMNDAAVNGLDQEITYYLYDCEKHREFVLSHRVEPRLGDKFPNEAELRQVFDRFLRELPAGIALSRY